MHGKKMQHDYAETFQELSYIEFITEESIIYQGEEHWKPSIVSESDVYRSLSQQSFRVGIQAQELFKQQATSLGYMLEELNQDQKSFHHYTSVAKNIPIKRGDFLIRNYGNIEIDIKCRTFKRHGDTVCFDLKCEDVEKHNNMENHFTYTPILIAVYEHINGRPIEENIFMFSIAKLLNTPSIEKYNKDGVGMCYKIPVDFTIPGFVLIENTFRYMCRISDTSKDKAYTVAEKRILNPNAYKKWTKEEDERLELYYCEGRSIRELSKIFERNNGAIRARIQKLELHLKY
jgi:hypothetical protein